MVQVLSATNSSLVSASSTTWVDVCEIGAGSFTANATYLILAYAINDTNTALEESRIRLVRGTTPTEFTDASHAVEQFNATSKDQAGYLYKFTQPGTAELVKLQVSSSSTNTTNVRAHSGRIIAINLDDIGSDGTDYHFNEVTADYTTTASPVAQASVTISPNGTDKWLLIGAFAINTADASVSSWEARLVLNGTTVHDIIEEGEDNTNEQRNRMVLWAGTPGSGSQTAQLHFLHESVAHTVYSSRVFALNLTATFAQVGVSSATGPTSLVESSGWINVAQVALTPDATGDFILLGAVEIDYNTSLSNQPQIRMRHNNSGSFVSEPNYGDDGPGWAGQSAWDGTDQIAYVLMAVTSLTTGASRTVELDGQMAATGVADPNVDSRSLVVVSVASAGGGDTALAGAAGGTSTATGNLTTSITLVGTTDGASTADGILTTQIALAGAAGGIAAASGDLTTAIALAGSAGGSSTADGSLGGADTALAGAAGGSSTATANLTTAISLAGAAAGSSTGASTLTTAILLVGAAAGSSTATASFFADTTLAGAAAGRSSASGFFWPTPLRAEYAIELFSSDGSFGPGTKIGEVWDARNIGWSTYDRVPGKAFFTISQTSPAVTLLDPLLTHVKVWRITGGSAMVVYAGVVVDHDSTGDDIIVPCFDYLALLAVSRAGFKTLYPSKKIGTEIVSPEWTAAKTATSSPLAFVTTGTIEDPLGTDDTTPITTSAAFGTLDQQRLQLMFDLSEIGRANTDHHVTYGISRSTPHTFTFSKDKGTAKDVAFVLNGNVSDYRYIPNWLRYRNDIATIGQDAAGAPTEIVKSDAGAAAARGLRQDVFPIQTLLGVAGAATEADQQQAVTARALKRGLQLQPAISLRMLAGSHDPLVGYDICDKVKIELGNGKESISENWRVIGLTCLVTEPGEQIGVIVSPVLV